MRSSRRMARRWMMRRGCRREAMSFEVRRSRTAAQVEGAARDGKAGREGEEDAEALRDAAHVHSGEADEDARSPATNNTRYCAVSRRLRTVPCRISTVGFQELASEPCLHLSAHTALH